MMKRGDIYYANLDPTVGGEARKKRPVLIVSNNASNRCADILTIVPLTSNIKKVYSFEVLFEKKDSGLPKASKAQCNQIRTISKLRIAGSKPVGGVNGTLMSQVNYAMRLHLAL